MNNLNVLSQETLINIIMDQDKVIGEQQFHIDSIYEDYDELTTEFKVMEHKRDYWRTKYNETKQTKTVTREFSKPVIIKEPVEFKINIRKGERPMTKEVVKYKHNKKSAAGNLCNSKHSGHKCKDDVLYGLKDGQVYEFDTVNEAKDEVRLNEKYATSGLTNISTYARSNRSIYGWAWTYEPSVAARWIK